MVELITATLRVFTIQYANFVFKALRIETEEDVHKLVTFFIRKAEDKRPDTESTLSEEDNSRLQLIFLLCHIKLV